MYSSKNVCLPPLNSSFTVTSVLIGIGSFSKSPMVLQVQERTFLSSFSFIVIFPRHNNASAAMISSTV